MKLTKDNKIVLLVAGLAAGYYFFLRPRPGPGSGGYISYGGGFGGGDFGGTEELLDLEALRLDIWHNVLNDPTLNLAGASGPHESAATSGDGADGAFDLSAHRASVYDSLAAQLAASGDVDVVHPANIGKTPLQVARDRRYSSVAAQLAAGGDVDVVHPANIGKTPLQVFRDRVLASVSTPSNNLANVHGGDTPLPAPLNVGGTSPSDRAFGVTTPSKPKQHMAPSGPEEAPHPPATPRPPAGANQHGPRGG